MKAVDIKADYVNYQFHVFQDNHWVDIKLPAEVQAALMRQVVADCCQAFKQVLTPQFSENPPGLEALMPH